MSSNQKPNPQNPSPPQKYTKINGRIDLRRRQTRSKVQNPIQLSREQKQKSHQGAVEISPFLKISSPRDRVGGKQRRIEREKE